MTQKTFVYCTFQKEGYHYFPGADTNPAYATGDKYDVSHLGLRHRHIFHFKVWIEVKSDNREIEFIQLKRWCESLYSDNILDLNHRSCEMIAQDLYAKISEKYPSREVRIDISEDHENGAYVLFG